MSPTSRPRVARPLHASIQFRRSALVLLSLASCALSSSSAQASVQLAASSAARASAVSGVAPVLVPPSAMRVDPGATTDQPLHATDADGDPLTFSKTFGPAYMTVTTTDPGSGSATGNVHLAPPIPTDIGPTSGSVAVSDGVFSDQRSFAIVISTTPPVLEQPADMSVTEGASADQPLRATDPDGDPVTFRLVSGPAYATVTTVNPGTGAATGNAHLAPGAGDAGTATADVGASDGIVEDVKRFEITVARLNHAPVLDPLLPMVAVPQTEVFQTVHASDPDLDPLTLFMTGGPRYATLTTTSSTGGDVTGTIRLEPGLGDIGSAAAEVGVTDGGLSDTRLLTIQVMMSAPRCPTGGLMLVPPARRAPEPRFSSAFRAYDPSLQPQSFELEDVDGDGVEDVVSASNQCGIVILFGSQGGTFGRTLRLDTGGAGARAVAVADFNGDGIQDVAAPNQFTDNFALFLGAGGGSFHDPMLYPSGRTPVHIVAGDLNRDGWPDLVTTDEGNNVVSVFLNDGSGGFAVRRTEPVGVKPCFTTIEDLNRDGMLDIATINENSNSVSVLLGNGDGTFRPQTQYATGGDPRSVVAGDLDKNGTLDLVVANFAGTVSSLLGNGDGTFAPRNDVQAGNNPWSAALGDVNSDGILDCVTANVGSSNGTVLLGRGDGTFTFHGQFPGGFLARYAELEDVNGDGKLDVLLVSEGGNTLTVHPGNGDGTFGSQHIATMGTSPLAAAVGDWNRDGRLDLVTSSSDSPYLTVGLGLGDGGLAPRATYSVGRATTTVRPADFNGDGIPDLAAAFLDGTGLATLPGNGDGSFGPAMFVPVAGLPFAFQVGDVTGDGFPDLVVPDPTGGVLGILAGHGDGTFSTSAPVGVGAHPFAVALGDLDGDGSLDAVTANGAEGTVSILRGVGGSLSLLSVLPVGGNASDAAIADLDRDGRPDLVVGRDHEVLTLRGRGDGTFEAAKVVPTLGAAVGIVIGDLNGDSIPDVALAGGGFVAVLPGAGDGTLDPYLAFGGAPGRPAIGDLNGDGRPDIIAPSLFDDGVSYLLNEGNRAPIADPGGPYAGTARIPLELDGSHSADPDGDPLRYSWDFGDGRTGQGVQPAHTYDAAGDYRVKLTVSDDALADVDSTVARIGGVLDARAFVTAENRVVRLFGNRPATCIQLEPVGGDFLIADVDLATVRMRSSLAGSVGEISALSEKAGVSRDRDGNGIQELSVCFASEDLRTLFQSVRGRIQTGVSLDGALRSGARFVANLSLTIQGTGGFPAVAVSPNPLNRSSTISVLTSRPGRISLRLFDAQGRLVRVMLEEAMAAPGVHEARIGESPTGGTPLPSGIYFYRIQTVDGEATGRVSIVK